MKNRIIEYDTLRIMAVITVVIGHSAYLEWGGDNGFISCVSDIYSPVMWSIPIRILQFLSGWVYSFHMPLFFILSGACYEATGGCSHYNNNIDKLVVKKTKSLIVPLLLIAVLYMIPLKRLVGFYDNTTAFQSIQFLLSGTNAYGHLWFLLTLFWVFILFFLLEKSIGQFSIFLCLLITILMECFSTYFYGKISFLDKYYWVIAVRNLKYFAIGYYFNKKRKIFEKYNSTIMCAICMILSIVNSFYPFMDTICSALITSLGFYYLAVQISHSRLLIENALYKQLLSCNFYIYLFHDPLNFVWIKIAAELKMLQSGLGVIIFCALWEILQFLYAFIM